LSFSLDPALVEGLILQLDSLDFSLDLLLPLIALILKAVVAAVLEAADLVQFGLFLNLEERLLNSFSKKYVEDGLHFSIIIKEVIIFNLSGLVHTCLLRDIGRSRRARQELVGLYLAFDLFRLLLALLRKVLGQINLNAGGRARSEVVGRDLILRFLELDKLVLNHFKFESLTFCLDSEFVTLSRGQVIPTFQNVNSVGIASEDTLVMHNIEGSPSVLHVSGVGLLLYVTQALRILLVCIVLVLLSEDLRLCASESIRHPLNSNYILFLKCISNCKSSY
jgi:hypothetical protein